MLSGGLPRYKTEEMKILIISFPRVEIELKTVVSLVANLGTFTTTALINIRIRNKVNFGLTLQTKS